MDNLGKLRKEVMSIDSDIINLLKKRFELTNKIQTYKKIKFIEIEDSNYEKIQNEFYKREAKKLNIPDTLVIDVFDIIRSEAKKV